MNTYGAQMDRKWPEVDRKWTGSVHLSVCPSQTLPLPPWRTLCEGSTSAGRLRPAIFLPAIPPHILHENNLSPLVRQALWNLLKVRFFCWRDSCQDCWNMTFYGFCDKRYLMYFKIRIQSNIWSIWKYFGNKRIFIEDVQTYFESVLNVKF